MSSKRLSEALFPWVPLDGQASTPATPPTGTFRLFVDTDGLLKWVDDAGTVVDPQIDPSGTRDGQVLQADGAGSTEFGGALFVQSSSPTGPEDGDVWFNTDVNVLYARWDAEWRAMAGGVEPPPFAVEWHEAGQKTDNSVGTSVASTTVDQPDDVEEGDLIVVVIHGSHGLQVGNWTAPSGFTLAASGGTVVNAGNRGSTLIYFKEATASEPADYTFSSTNSQRMTSIAARVTGSDLTAHDTSGAGSGGSYVSSIIAPSVDAFGESLLIASVAVGEAGTFTVGSPGSMDDVYNLSTSNAGLIAVEPVPSGPTGDRTFTVSPNRSLAVAMLALGAE